MKPTVYKIAAIEGPGNGGSGSQIPFEFFNRQIGLKSEFKSLGDIISALLPLLFVFAGLGVLLYLLYGGFQLMTSGGDPKGIAEGKGKITNAVVGFVIIFVAFWVIQAVGIIFGIEGLQQIFG